MASLSSLDINLELAMLCRVTSARNLPECPYKTCVAVIAIGILVCRTPRNLRPRVSAVVASDNTGLQSYPVTKQEFKNLQ